MDDPEKLQAEYVRGWQDWQKALSLPKPAGGKAPAAISTGSARPCLQTHGDAERPGRDRRQPLDPLGQSRAATWPESTGTGGYHLVWPRDLVESPAGCWPPAPGPTALRVLAYLRATQMPDGHWPQNMWASSASRLGRASSSARPLFPILLLDLLAPRGALPPTTSPRYWPMVRRAVAYIVRNGPSTQQDRWENRARLYAVYPRDCDRRAPDRRRAGRCQRRGQHVGAYLCETADAWNTAIESWLYVTDTDLARRLGVEGYYARSIPPEQDEGAAPRRRRVKLKETPTAKGGFLVTEVVSPDALALVRFGLRRPDDPRIVATVKVIDAVLKVETPGGPAWRRYNGDGYGETPDGSPFGPGPGWRRRPGVAAADGRAGALRAGRRASRRGRSACCTPWSRSRATGGMIPEQVWDSDDIPERGLFLGRPSGSAMPLAWAHAEYLKLRRSIQAGRVFDMPPQTAERYLAEKVVSNRAIWRFDHQRSEVLAGDILRVEARAPALIRWSQDGWKTAHEYTTTDTGLGIHVADLPTRGRKGAHRWPSLSTGSRPGAGKGEISS